MERQFRALMRQSPIVRMKRPDTRMCKIPRSPSRGANPEAVLY